MAAGADPRAGAERLQVPPVPIGAARLGCQAAGARLAAEGMSVTVITATESLPLIVIAIIIIISRTVFGANARSWHKSCMPPCVLHTERNHCIYLYSYYNYNSV